MSHPAAGEVPGGRSGDAESGGAGAPEPPATSRREHAIRGTLAACLCLEGLTVLFVPQTVARVGDGGLTGVRLGLLLALAAALFVTAGLQRSRLGPVLGSVLQVAVVATGALVGAMYFLGLLFAGVWVFLLRVRQDLVRAAAPPPADRPAAGA